MSRLVIDHNLKRITLHLTCSTLSRCVGGKVLSLAFVKVEGKCVEIKLSKFPCKYEGHGRHWLLKLPATR